MIVDAIKYDNILKTVVASNQRILLEVFNQITSFDLLERKESIPDLYQKYGTLIGDDPNKARIAIK